MLALGSGQFPCPAGAAGWRQCRRLWEQHSPVHLPSGCQCFHPKACSSPPLWTSIAPWQCLQGQNVPRWAEDVGLSLPAHALSSSSSLPVHSYYLLRQCSFLSWRFYSIRCVLREDMLVLDVRRVLWSTAGTSCAAHTIPWLWEEQSLVASHVPSCRRAALQTSLQGVPAPQRRTTLSSLQDLPPQRPLQRTGDVSSVKHLQTCPHPRAALARDMEDR